VTLCIGVSIQRSYSIAGYLQQIGNDKVAAGANGVGRDFAINVWIPTHALIANMDPYDPQDTKVRTHYHRDVPASLYTPSILLFLLPISSLSLSNAAEAMNIVNILLLWLSLLVLIPPRDIRSCIIVALLGLVTIGGYAAETGLSFGQPIGLVTFGLALVVRALAFGAGDLVLAGGLVLLLTKAQFGVPIVILVLALRRWRAAVAAIVVTAITSLPFTVLLVRAAGGVRNTITVLHRAATFQQTLTERQTDLLPLLTRNHGTIGVPFLASQLFLVVGVAIFLLRAQGFTTNVAASVSLLVATALLATYHLWYDLTVLVVPAAVVAARPAIAWRKAPLVVIAVAAFVAVNLATRGASRIRLEAMGAHRIVHALDHSFDNYWPAGITLLLFTVAGLSLLRDRGRTGLEPGR
jgi:hypothetical protein